MTFKTLRSWTPTILLLCSCSAVASPLQHASDGRGQDVVSSLWRRADDDSRFSPTIWIPVVIVSVILIGVGLLSWSNRTVRGGIGSFLHSSAAAGQAVPISGAPRELTAEQLAGTINANTSGTTQTAGRTRRTRRPRRTPSQVSVTSLPPYNKEPGEQELVIFRGQDMEDAAMPRAIVMSSVDEDGESSLHSGDQSQVSRYSPMPTSPNNMPLLHDDYNRSGDLSLQSIQSNTGINAMPRRSYDTNHSSQEASSLVRIDSNASDVPDPRGEAPAYFEVVDQSTLDNMQRQQSQQPSSAPTTANSDQPLRSGNSLSPPGSPERQERRSGLRTLFNRISVVGTPRAVGHARGDSATSYMSSNLSHNGPSQEASTSPATPRHRPSPSTSSSFFRTLSRQRSQTALNSVNNSMRLNSPSLISLNSISAPLTHTAVRTDFTYPKSGLTAEQLKVISSRESFARFGVPYGADAIAYASSTSRVELVPPPPDFESVAGSSMTNLTIPNGNMIGGHARSHSAGQLSSSSTLPEMELTLTTSHNAGSQEHQSLSPLAQESAPPASQPYPPPPQLLSTSQSATSTVSSIASVAKSAVVLNGTNNKSSKVTTEYLQPSSSAKTSTSTSTPFSSNSALMVSEFGKLAAPPSSYAFDTASSSRSESRASAYSNQSFATAAESWRDHVDGSDVEAEDNEPSTPTTRKLSLSSSSVTGGHAQEPTDSTIIAPKDDNDASSALVSTS